MASFKRKTAGSFDLCMHAWSETKERELLTFRGNIKGQCGNCVLQANCLSVPEICAYNRHQIAISCHFFFHSFGRKHADVLTSSCAGHLIKTIKIGPTQKHVTSCVTSKVSFDINQIPQRKAAKKRTFVLDAACEATSSPALFHFCIKG